MERPYNKLTAYTIGIIDTRRGNITNIKNKIDVSDADTVYIGSPIWAWTVSSPLNSYLKNAGLSGKKIIPFCTHGGNYGDFFEKIKELTPNCKYGEGHDFSLVNKKSDKEILEEVKQWISIE